MHANSFLGSLVQLCAPLLVGGVVSAQPPFPEGREVPLPEGIVALSGKVDAEAIPQWQAIWAQMFVKTIVIEEGSSGSGASALKHEFDLEDPTAAALFQHVQSAFETRKRVASAARDDVCGRRDEIVTTEDLVRAVGKIKQVSDDAGFEAVARVEGIVGADVYRRIREAIDKVRASMLAFDEDLPTLLANEPPSAVAERTARICSRSTTVAPVR